MAINNNNYLIRDVTASATVALAIFVRVRNRLTTTINTVYYYCLLLCITPLDMVPPMNVINIRRPLIIIIAAKTYYSQRTDRSALRGGA